MRNMLLAALCATLARLRLQQDRRVSTARRRGPPPPMRRPPKARRASPSRRMACTCSTACTAAASPRWCSSTAGPATRTTGANRCRCSSASTPWSPSISPGHGGTDGNRSEWTIAHFGQDVATAFAAVPSQQIILVGHSMGGPVAIEAARQLEETRHRHHRRRHLQHRGRARADQGAGGRASSSRSRPISSATRASSSPSTCSRRAPTTSSPTRWPTTCRCRRRASPSRRCARCSNTTSTSRSRSSAVPIVAIDSDLGEPGERGAHPQGAAEIPRDHHQRCRPFPHDGRPGDASTRRSQTEIQALRNRRG